MKPQWILVCTCLGFPIAYFFPHYGPYAVTAFWVVFSCWGIYRQRGIEYYNNLLDCQDLLHIVLGYNIKQENLWLSSYNKHLKAVPMDLFKTHRGTKRIKTYLSLFVAEG